MVVNISFLQTFMLEVSFKRLLSCTKTGHSFKLNGEPANTCCSADPSSSLISVRDVHPSKSGLQYLFQLSTRLDYGRSISGVEKSSAGAAAIVTNELPVLFVCFKQV